MRLTKDGFLTTTATGNASRNLHKLSSKVPLRKLPHWHQHGPYYFVEGAQTVSMWIPLDPVQDTSLRLIAGSHKWAGMVRPVSWADDSDFYESDGNWTPVPDPNASPVENEVLEWAMESGDVVLFEYRTVHGAR